MWSMTLSIFDCAFVDINMLFAADGFHSKLSSSEMVYSICHISPKDTIWKFWLFCPMSMLRTLGNTDILTTTTVILKFFERLEFRTINYVFMIILLEWVRMIIVYKGFAKNSFCSEFRLMVLLCRKEQFVNLLINYYNNLSKQIWGILRKIYAALTLQNEEDLLCNMNWWPRSIL